MLSYPQLLKRVFPPPHEEPPPKTNKPHEKNQSFKLFNESKKFSLQGIFFLEKNVGALLLICFQSYLLVNVPHPLMQEKGTTTNYNPCPPPDKNFPPHDSKKGFSEFPKQLAQLLKTSPSIRPLCSPFYETDTQNGFEL